MKKLRGKQVNTGFYEAFLSLVKGLRRLGYDVRINDYDAARKNPAYPIGLAGYPEVLEHVQLPNPIIFGPGDPGYPDRAASLAKRAALRFIIQPSDWSVELYRPYCGDKMLRCPVGIDCDAISDSSTIAKSCDVLIYDKIHWHRNTVVRSVIGQLTEVLKARSLSYQVIRYGEHTQSDYFQRLRVSRAMAFVAHHETQGLACEEALAINVPVFAWDEGVLVDPKQLAYATDSLRVTTVPYFDERCGMTFRADEIEEKFEKFWAKLGEYNPRAFICESLSLELAAEVFAKAYESMIAE